MGRPIKDITGKTFGRLTVFSLHPVRTKGNNARWVCKCECGNETLVDSNHLHSGDTVSCGCYRRESNTIHGLYQHDLYPTWTDMMTRCYNPRRKYYKDYGGRGIKVMERWYAVAVFINDILASIGPCPEGMSFDRINNNMNYEWGNVRWATAQIQAQNTRSWSKGRDKSFQRAENIRTLLAD